MLKKLSKFANKQEGATAIEYALMVVVIALVMMVGATLLGNGLKASFTSTATAVNPG